MASKFNFGKRLRVTGHEYRQMDYGAALRCGCSCENRFASKRWRPSFNDLRKILAPNMSITLTNEGAPVMLRSYDDQL